MSRALIVSNDHIGTSMAGPGIRSYWFARELAAEYEVTLVVPFDTDIVLDGIELVHANPWDPVAMTELVDGYDVVVAQRLPVPTMQTVAASRTRAIYDLYAPLTIEQLALDTGQRAAPHAQTAARLNNLTQRVALATGDAFICASDRQRDLWLGALMAINRIDHERYRRDPSLRDFVDVVPFGVEPEPPRATRAVLKGVVPGIGEKDRVLLWPGGVWNWFDPLTVIQAVARLATRRDDLRLYFLGMRHPNPGVPEMEMAARALALADELGVRDSVVFFNDGWVPYDDRGAYLLEADLGVSAHFDDLETRFAFRTRLLDCFWAGLPVVTTRGDALGDLVQERGLGRSIDFEDVDGWVGAIDELLNDDDARRSAAERTVELRTALAWPRVVEPLRRLARPPVDGYAPPRRDRAAAVEYLRLRVRYGLAHRGIRGAAQRIARVALARATRPVRRRRIP